MRVAGEGVAIAIIGVLLACPSRCVCNKAAHLQLSKRRNRLRYAIVPQVALLAKVLTR